MWLYLETVKQTVYGKIGNIQSRKLGAENPAKCKSAREFKNLPSCVGSLDVSDSSPVQQFHSVFASFRSMKQLRPSTS